MKYLYYPGCSLKGTGRAYEESLLAVFKALGLDIEEMPDWNCCGATAYMAVDEMKAFALAARNLAVAAGGNGAAGVQLVAPCSACYLVLEKVKQYMQEYPKVGRKISAALAEAGLQYRPNVTVRHPLDVLVNDVGLAAVKEQVSAPLEGLKVACYYGCQVVRPYATFDDRHDPQTMDQLVKACGGTPVDWPLKTRCCGGSLTGTIEEVGLPLSHILLREARRRGAEVVITCCPLCQFNLECYQQQMRQRFDWGDDMPVVYFTQLLGRAMGLTDEQLGLQRLFVSLGATGATATAAPAGA